MFGQLLRSVRFLPLFLTQFTGALNDNLIKNGMVVLIAYRAAEGGAPLIAAAGGVFILPYALFSSMAGRLADRFDKSRLIRITKLFEVALMLLAGAGFLTDNLAALFVVLFGLGVQATFFGPLKYGILPDHLSEEELLSGNGLIEAGTFAAILIGTIAGGALIGFDNGALILSVVAIASSLTGTVSAFAVPKAPAADPDLTIGWNQWAETATLIREARDNRTVWLSILGISWFWNFGAILLAAFPVIGKDMLHAESAVVTLLLTVFAFGVGIGSVLAAQLLKGEVSARHVPFAALALSLFGWEFARAVLAAGDTIPTVAAVLAHPAGWRLMADLFLLAVAGGIYSVPLYALVQEKSAPAYRSRMIAANNIMNAAFMVAGAIVSAGLSSQGVSQTTIIIATAALNLIATAIIVRLIPQEVAAELFRWYFRVFHAAEVKGLDNYRAAGPRKVIAINHLSFLDGCFVAAHLPGEATFAIDATIAKTAWVRLLLGIVKVFAVDPANPFAVKSMIKTVKEGTPLVIFPEGRITRTGALMKIYEGAGTIAEKADADLIPVHIDGLQFSRLSRLGGKARLRLFPKISMEILPPVRLEIDPAVKGRKRRQVVGTALQDLMINATFATRQKDRTLFSAVLDARDRYGAQQVIVEDIARTPLTYKRLILGAVILGRRFAALSDPGQAVGLLLPNANATLVSLIGLWAFARVAKPLNFSSGADGIIATCTAAGVKTIVTSRQFVERAKLAPLVARLGEGFRVVYLEDIRTGISLGAKLRGMIDARFARRLPGSRQDPASTAVVLSTSGSEGAPKAVLHSHETLLANCAQVAAVVDFNPSDRVLNAMPVFHSFGLTGGTILPLLHGVAIFFYPSPLHFKIVPEVIYNTDATIVFGTDTFLAGWARFAHPYDFYAVRYVFSGAEKVRDETRRLYMDRFGVRLLEGYGATETAPVLSINTAMHNRPGSVGRFLPGIEWRLDPVPGVEDGGRLVVRGPNVMQGYMRVTAPGVIEPPAEGWYDTGDVVRVDAEGFVFIVGRLKRFAKIAGEMISMAAAEALATALWPAAQHAVVAIPDARKGEALVLVTTQADATGPALLAAARERGIAELMVPRVVQAVDKIPLLATGKTDYPGVQKLVTSSPAAKTEV